MHILNIVTPQIVQQVPEYKAKVIFIPLTFLHENKRHSMTLMIHGKVNPLPVVQGGVLLQMENY